MARCSVCRTPSSNRSDVVWALDDPAPRSRRIASRRAVRAEACRWCMMSHGELKSHQAPPSSLRNLGPEARFIDKGLADPVDLPPDPTAHQPVGAERPGVLAQRCDMVGTRT